MKKLRFPPHETWWWVWKYDTVAFAPNFNEKSVGDQDGEWESKGFGFYRLVVDLRQGGYL